MVRCLVDLHAVDPDAVGLGDFGRAAGYLERQLTRWHKQWDSSRTRDLPAVAELIDRLGRSLPGHQGTGIVHGDFKIDNVMVRPEEPHRIVALLDWEMSTLGDPLADLGILVSFWDRDGELWNPISAGATAHPGFLTADEVVHRYATLRGDARVDDLDWYVVFADLKIAVILEGIHARHRQGQTVGDGFDDVGAMVEPLLERALDRASRSAVPELRG
jgi:aminoglycoside phosphotransferase (APT) family kinase protein